MNNQPSGETLETTDSVLLDFIDVTVAADSYRDLAARILNATASRLNADIATLWRAVKEDSRHYLTLAATYKVEFLPEERQPIYDLPSANLPNDAIKGLTAWIAVRREPVRVSSKYELKDKAKPWFGSHSGEWDGDQFWKDKQFGSLLGYPLILNDDLFGVIKFERYSKSIPFSDIEEEQVKKWSRFIALILKGMVSREKQESKRQEALRELSSKLLHPTSQTYYDDIVKLATQILHADFCTLWLLDKKSNSLYLASHYGLSSEALRAIKAYPIPQSDNIKDDDIDGLTVWTFIRKRPFYAHDWERLKEHKSHKGHWDATQWHDNPQNEFGCMYAAPLVVEGVAIGVIKVEKVKRPGYQPFTEVERSTFDHIAVMVSVAPPLKAVIRDKDALVLNYFHILRAPTSNAIMALDSLRNELKRNEGSRQERIHKYLKMLSDNLAVAYTQTLNAFVVATSPGRPPMINWRNLQSEVIVSSIKMFNLLYPDTQIEIHPNTIKYDLYISDSQLKSINVILHNLVDNAISFSESKPVSINVSEDNNNSTLSISIVDNGSGIPEDKLDAVWEPGVTLRSDALTKPESRGQGLAIVLQIVEQLGWTTKLTSIINKGTTVILNIPKSYWRYNNETRMHS